MRYARWKPEETWPCYLKAMMLSLDGKRLSEVCLTCTLLGWLPPPRDAYNLRWSLRSCYIKHSMQFITEQTLALARVSEEIQRRQYLGIDSLGFIYLYYLLPWETSLTPKGLSFFTCKLRTSPEIGQDTLASHLMK